MTAKRLAGGKIAILVKTYPKLSETFVLGEILGLERRGLELKIYSLSPPDGARAHAHASEVKARVDYVPMASLKNAARIFAQHLGLLLRQPRGYLSTLLFTARLSESNRTAMFEQAGCVARSLLKDHVVHVHAHFANYPAGVAELAKRMTGISYSISAHAKDIFLSSPEALRRKIHGARFTATCTDYNRRYLLNIAGKTARVVRVYHGMDAERFRPVVDPASIITSVCRPLILSVGRLREKKGFPVLIEACRLLREAGISFRCQIVGEGPEYERLRRLIVSAGLQDAVELVGKLFHDELIELYRNTSIFVLPSQIAGDGDRDGLPNVLLEAMAMGLPVISTNVSAIPEAVKNGENGILVAQQDPQTLALAMRELLERPPQRARYGQAGRETVVRDFSPSRNLEPLYELLLSASRGDSDRSEFSTEIGGLSDAN